MNETIIIGGLILLLGVIFYRLLRQGSQQLKSINTAVHEEAKVKGLQIKNIISPSFKEWKNSPFDSEKKRGSIGFEGMPYIREFYRVVTYQDSKSGAEKTIWVQVTKNKNDTLTLQWKEKNQQH